MKKYSWKCCRERQTVSLKKANSKRPIVCKHCGKNVSEKERPNAVGYYGFEKL